MNEPERPLDEVILEQAEEIVAGAQRDELVDDDADQPCHRCRCCSLWTAALEVLRDSIRTHVAGELRLKPCSPECLVCGEVEWQG